MQCKRWSLTKYVFIAELNDILVQFRSLYILLLTMQQEGPISFYYVVAFDK